ncbi:MAG: hypothetical protein KIT54_12165 [Phycisphaeraceae bacterium]|nr:hypothetical protein [Phycisphaeraceae bacterium]
MAKYPDWCASAGLDWSNEKPPDHRQVALALYVARLELPSSLAFEACMLADLSDREFEYSIFALADKHGIESDPNASLEDTVLKLVLIAPKDVYELHVKSAPVRYLRMDRLLPTKHVDASGFTVTPAKRRQLTDFLNARFEKLNRDRSAEVYPIQEDRFTRLLISRGETIKRQTVVVANGRELRIFRPEVFDMLCIDHHTGELLVHCTTQADRKLYSQAVGTVLFDDVQRYDVKSGPRRFDFTALYERREALFEGVSVPGMMYIRLHSARWNRGDLDGGVSTHAGPDIWDVLNQLESFNPVVTPIDRIGIKAKMSASPKERTVSLTLPFTASYGTDAQGLAIEEALRQMEILLDEQRALREYQDKHLARHPTPASQRSDSPSMEPASG